MAIEEYDVILVTKEDKSFGTYTEVKAIQKILGCKKNHFKNLDGMVHVIDQYNNHYAFCEICGHAVSLDKPNSVFMFGKNEVLCTNPIKLNGDIANKLRRFIEIREKIRGSDPQTFKQWYNEYLQSDVWKRRRQRVLERANYLCESCMEEPATLVHHLTYDRVGKEPLFDLVALCDNCHKQIHNIQKG